MLMSKINFKKNIILIYFLVENNLKNNFYHILKHFLIISMAF